MGAIGRVALVPGAGVLLTLAVASADADPALVVRVEVRPREATIGDQLDVRIEVGLMSKVQCDLLNYFSTYRSVNRKLNQRLDIRQGLGER